MSLGIFSARTVSVGDLFMGAIVPGFILVFAYVCYVFIKAQLQPATAPAQEVKKIHNRGKIILTTLLPPLLLIASVLGSILLGIATPTEAAGVGALGAMLLALSKGSLNKEIEDQEKYSVLLGKSPKVKISRGKLLSKADISEHLSLL